MAAAIQNRRSRRCGAARASNRPSVRYTTAEFIAWALGKLALSTGTIYVDSHLSVVRRRSIGEGFHEDIVLINHGNEAMEVEVRIEAAADFADLFEVKDKLENPQLDENTLSPLVRRTLMIALGLVIVVMLFIGVNYDSASTASVST